MANNPLEQVSPQLRDNIVAHSNPNAPLATKWHPKKWKKLEGELEQLISASVAESNAQQQWR